MSITNSPVAGHTVATGTMGTGLATWMEWIPNEIGKLATLVGILLSVTLIVMHIRKMRYEARESDLRVQLLREQLRKERGEVSPTYSE